MAVLKLECPATNKDRGVRVADLRENVAGWIYSEPLKRLIDIFGGTAPTGLGFYDYITWVNEFAEIWNYRGRQNGSKERWAVEDDEIVMKNSEAILQIAEELGLMGVEEPTEVPDYVLPLGGARLTNYARPQLARKVLDAQNNSPAQIVALTGKRPINEIEREYLADYAPDAVTEYDAMCGGIEKAFGLEGSGYLETSYYTSNINMQWSIRNYEKKYSESDVVVLAAPSTDEGRRANSYDTFKFFLEKFHVAEGQKVLLVTSGIYVPFQLMKFIPIALERNIYVDCVGLNNAKAGVAFSKPSNYCQEIKAAINAIKVLADLYWREER